MVLINVVICREGFQNSCRVLGARLRKVKTAHLMFHDSSGYMLDPFSPPFRENFPDESEYAFLRHLTALEDLRIERCVHWLRDFNRPACWHWMDEYLSVSPHSRVCKCSYPYCELAADEDDDPADDPDDDKCWDISGYYYNIVAKGLPY